MSGHNHQDSPPQHQEQQSNVRVIPIQVEGRDAPVLNKSVDHGTHFAESKPHYEPKPINKDYFDQDPSNYRHPHNFGKAFGGPSHYKTGPQPFVQQNAYPMNAGVFNRGASPHRSQSPRPESHEEYVKVPVHHEQTASKPEQQRPPPKQQQQQGRAPQQPQQPKPRQQPPPCQSPPRQPSPPPQPKPQPPANDPITQILAIQTDVLNLMTEVENFTGSKKDKRYIFLDEMLTRNLIKLDIIETDGKENIRTARKEAIRCIQKCIAVLEAKAEKGSAALAQGAENAEGKVEGGTTENGEVEMNDSKEEAKVDSQPERPAEKEQTLEQKEKMETQPLENKEAPPQASDTRLEQPAPVSDNQDPKNEESNPEPNEQKPETEENVDNKNKKGAKNVKNRDKSKDKSAKDSKDKQVKDVEPMQVDDKGDKPDSQAMEVDGATSQF